MATAQYAFQLSELIDGADSYSIINQQVKFNVVNNWTMAAGETAQFVAYWPTGTTEANGD